MSRTNDILNGLRKPTWHIPESMLKRINKEKKSRQKVIEGYVPYLQDIDGLLSFDQNILGLLPVIHRKKVKWYEKPKKIRITIEEVRRKKNDKQKWQVSD